MGAIPGGVRGGLMELFYGVYERDADRCLEALITMGVLVPTGDKLAVRRTAQFFLNSFQVGLGDLSAFLHMNCTARLNLTRLVIC